MGAPYIYDISRLKVNDLTLVLLTWRKSLAPNNASRQQMGFNSGFKGLNIPRLFYPKKEIGYHIVQEAGWDPTAGLGGCGKCRDPKISRTPNRPARNISLCRLS